MRKSWLIITTLFAGCFFLEACKKNSVVEQYIPIVNPVTPDFTTAVNASLNGFITDENGNAVEGASIKGGNITVSSDKFGYFKISNAGFAKSAGFVRVTKAGYFTGYSSFLPREGKENFIRLQLIPKIISGNVEASAGGTITTTDGAKVILPASGIVTAAGGAAYSGTVNIAAHWLNPAEEQTTLMTMPGNLTGVDSAGHLNVLQTFGMLAVELTGSNGELLQIAPGKKASLHFPIPSSLSGTAPASIPLWYFDETKGVWKQEGRAVKNGNNYEGEVSHFSYWNCDINLPLVNFTAQFVDSALNPLVNVPVSISSNLSNTIRTAYTDTNGIVNGFVPANSNLTIGIIVPPCNENVTINAISTANEAVDLGTTIVNLHQYAALIEGTATKCGGSPVTDGYVVIAGFGSNSIINVTNGVFSAASTICPGTSAAFIAYDRETSQQSEVHTLTLATGTNNAGELQACTNNSTDSISITLSNGGRYIYTLPQFLFGGNFYFSNDSTTINAIDLLNGNQEKVKFSFKGPATPGLHLLTPGLINTEVGTFLFTEDVFVNITSYGLVGEYITGSFTGTPFSWPPGSTCTVKFHIQRDQ